MESAKQLHIVVREAFRRGYRVTDDGKVIGSYGRELKLMYYPDKPKTYPRFSMNTKAMPEIPWDTYAIPAHWLAAYCFYGEKLFTTGLCIRHINGNKLDLSKDNIKLGTNKENEQDKDPAERKRVASIAGKAYVKKYGPSHLVNLRWGKG
jgi:hypothetical protein